MSSLPPIRSFSGPNHFLSNFFPAVVAYDGQTYSTVEHAYQAAKTLDEEQRAIIRKLPFPAYAKKAGKKVVMRSDWNAVKVPIMTELVWLKFHNHPLLMDKLLSTRGHQLIEGNTWGDRFWGVCPPTSANGKNMLGKILMAIRDEELLHRWENEFFTLE